MCPGAIMISQLRNAAAVAFLLLAVACSGSEEGGPGQPAGACSVDAECAEGQRCVDGTCSAAATLRITTTRLPPALVGSTWAATVEAADGKGSVTWSLIGPDWISIEPSTGKLGGRPPAADPVGSLLQIAAVDQSGNRADAQLRLQVRECTPGAEIACTEADASTCSVGVRICGQDGFFGSCVQLQPSNDAQRCGAACDACPDGSVCVDGRCSCGSDEHCAAGEKCCAGGCVPVLDDPANCGQCGNACPAPAAGTTVACEQGNCVQRCEDGFADCDQSETNGCEEPLDSDTNCGGCFVDCTAVHAPNAATARCEGDAAGAACVAVCNDPRWADCDADLVNGCERSTTASATDCGACNRACPPVPNAVPVCQFAERCLGATRDPACDGEAPLCGFTCNPGFADCDGNPSNGCEVNLGTDEANCGQCGRICNGTCANGGSSCSVSCTWPRADCDGNGFNGCEVDLSDNLNHCGMCGSSCEWGEACEGGSCCNNGGGTPGTCLPGCCAGLNCTRDPESGDRSCY